MSRFAPSRMQVMDSAGNPEVGAKLYFFATGTSTLKAIYSDSNFTTPIANPATSNADGMFPAIFLDGLYKVVLKDSGGTTITTDDPVGGVSTAAWGAWANDSTYSIPDIVLGSDDTYYRSLTEPNQGNNPVSSPVNWEPLLLLNNAAQTIAGDKTFSGNTNLTGGIMLGGAAVTATAAELNILDGVTATAAELNFNDGSIAGTAVASKTLVLGATKNIDTIDVALSGLKIAGTAVTSTAAKINYTDITTPGTAQASKALVLNSSSAITAGLGNIAVGGTARAWGVGHKTIDIGAVGSVIEFQTNKATVVYNNLYHDGTDFRFIENGYGSAIDQVLGVTRIYRTTASGLAGAVATLAVSVAVDATGVMTIGGNVARHDGNTFHGRVNANGTAIRLPAGWSVVKTATGRYSISHGLSTTALTVVGSYYTQTGLYSPGGEVSVAALSANTFTIDMSSGGALADLPFYFMVMLD